MKMEERQLTRVLQLLFLVALLLNCLSSSYSIISQFQTQSNEENPLLASVSAVQIVPTCPMNATPIVEAFTTVYNEGVWNGKDLKVFEQGPGAYYYNAEWPHPARSSPSGEGSNLGPSTIVSLDILRNLIKSENITSMVDMPCGDANWIFDSWETDSLPMYLGLDIVQHVVEANAVRFAHHKNKLFRHWNGVACPIPRYIKAGEIEETPFELIHVRDVVQHLRLPDGVKLFCNVFRSGARFLVTTTYPAETSNTALDSPGGFYRNNLLLPPFDFPEDMACTPTHPAHELDSTCVLDLKQPFVSSFVSNKC